MTRILIVLTALAIVYLVYAGLMAIMHSKRARFGVIVARVDFDEKGRRYLIKAAVTFALIFVMGALLAHLSDG